MEPRDVMMWVAVISYLLYALINFYGAELGVG